MQKQKKPLQIQDVSIDALNPSIYNPRKWPDSSLEHLKESIIKFGVVDPLLVNGAEKRKNIVIGGHMRLKICKELGHKIIPVVYLNIPDVEKEQELNIRLNKNTGDCYYSLAG